MTREQPHPTRCPICQASMQRSFNHNERTVTLSCRCGMETVLSLEAFRERLQDVRDGNTRAVPA